MAKKTGKLYGASADLSQTFDFKEPAPIDDRVAVKTREDLSLIRAYKGILTYVEDEDAYYSYGADEDGVYGWKKANLGGGGGGSGDGIPIYTQTKIDQMGGSLPSQYINIGNPEIKGSPATSSIDISQHSGDYKQIIFSAIRALQTEIARLKNTFYYGITSLKEGQTAGSEIINDAAEEEQEPLWAYDPEDLDELTELSLIINNSCELVPSSNFTYRSGDNYVDIIGRASTETINQELIDIEDNQYPTKVLVYATIEPKDNWEFTISFKDGTSVNLANLEGVKKQKCNILFIISRRVPLLGDESIQIGKNFYYLSISNVNNDLVYANYLDSSFIAHPQEISLESVSLIDKISLNNLKLFKLDFYTKEQAFSNDYDIIPEKATTDDFIYQTSHITVRSVTGYERLQSIKDRLLPDEPILVYDSDPAKAGLYFKTKTNTLYKIGGSSENPDDSGMTQQEMISWLLNNNLIVGTSEDGYELNVDLSKIDPNELKFSGVTLINEDTQTAYKLSVDYNGEIQCKQVDYDIDADTDQGSTDTSDSTRYGRRGAVARYTLASIDTERASDVSDVGTYNGNLVVKALGDRVRFGTWYIPNKNQTEFDCSHDYIEIVNGCTVNYPLQDAYLGIIYRNDVEEDPADIENPNKPRIYAKHFSVEEFPITGNIAAGSSYLIRNNCDSPSYTARKENYPYERARVKIENYDQEISFDFIQRECVGLLLYHKNLHEDLTTNDGGFTVLRALRRQAENTSTFTYDVDKRLIDVITFNGNHEKLVTAGNNALYTSASYTKTSNHIGKDQYVLDPARQGFRSLTLSKLESSNCRLEKVQGEQIPLNQDVVSFPHSANIIDVQKYAPKASYEKKNILTDKTSPDFNKPNMVTCSFGIDAATTRCFNWFSMSKRNEYVWIRKKGDIYWNRFESYKSTDGTNSPVTDSSTAMHRKEFAKHIVQKVYARMDNIFPGDDTYEYRAHKCIVYIQQAMNTGDPVIYEYCVGASDEQGLPVNVEPFDIQTFTIYPLDWKPRVYQTTDQQGFGWMEYQEWAAAAEELNQRILKECTVTTKQFPVLLNTGDMTQNGTRVNEWMDYYNAGKCLFNHLEQMNVVGNNDLCNAYSEKVLGNGDDNGKSSPYYFHVFYCYEIPNEIKNPEEHNLWSNPVIYNDIYVPSMYYFYFGQYGYLMVNSELTTVTCNKYFKQDVTYDDEFFNLYTGCSSKATNQLTEIVSDFLGNILSSWLDTLITNSGNDTSKIIVACHEMPFTVTTQANLLSGAANKDRSVSGSSLVGSHLNLLAPGFGSDNDYTYWFSTMLQLKGIKLCIGGHKHTYAITYPVADLLNGKLSTKTVDGYHFSKKAMILGVRPEGLTTIADNMWQYVNAFPSQSSENYVGSGVVYFMCQATGYKQKSNKELPHRFQGYSKIVPETQWTNDAEGTPDVSQTYPMYAVYEYDTVNHQIKANLYRVINIKKESIVQEGAQANKAKVTEFSETAFSEKTMYSEHLVIGEGDNFSTDRAYNNYWVVPSEFQSVCTGIENGTITDKQRCTYVSGTTYNIFGGTTKQMVSTNTIII